MASQPRMSTMAAKITAAAISGKEASRRRVNAQWKWRKDSTMAGRLWAYKNDFGWFAVDPETCGYDEGKVDTVAAVIESDTKHDLMAQAETQGYEIVMWLE